MQTQPMRVTRAFDRCAPSRPCPQQADCMRAQAPQSGHDSATIDGTVVRVKQQWCPLFVDTRWKLAA